MLKIENPLRLIPDKEVDRERSTWMISNVAIACSEMLCEGLGVKDVKCVQNGIWFQQCRGCLNAYFLPISAIAFNNGWPHWMPV